ncbi:MAG: MAPEG family protein, partial [Pseudomonadota bacterium]
WGERAERAYRNLLETFPLFAAFALAVAVTGTANGLSATGAWIYLAARVAYVPAYISGVPHVRSLIWVAAMVGIAMVGWPLLGAVFAAEAPAG